MKNIDSKVHVRGESLYVDDIPEIENTLHAGVVVSTIAHGRITSIDTHQTLAIDGVKRVVLAGDIPGENQIGGVIPDEELLAHDKVVFIGQPVAMVICDNRETIEKAIESVKIEYEEFEPVLNPKIAAKKGYIIGEPRIFQMGDIESSWQNCDVIVSGTVKSGGQEHLYIEGQGSYAFPIEKKSFKIISSTQGPTQVQRAAARILGLDMHNIEVEVTRIGGGFGGKEDQATVWGCLAVLGSYLTRLPVKLILDRKYDLQSTGKRHPYVSDYKLGLSAGGKIISYDVTYYQNAGAAADLSPAVLERTLFHANNSYFIPNLRATGYSCRTNFHPFTAFRGFGGPQGMFVIESALSEAADHMGIPKWKLQKLNLLNPGDRFHYGQQYNEIGFNEIFTRMENEFQLAKHLDAIEEYNKNSNRYKKGVALMPVTFGISFTKTSMNQAGALVHIYFDGSISVSTGAVEMGQGVNTRIFQVPLEIFSLPANYVKIETTNTTRVINTSPSAASSTHDLNGKATELACLDLLQRLLEVAKGMVGAESKTELKFLNSQLMFKDKNTNISWKDVVNQAYLNRVDLSAHGFYAPKDINYDKIKEDGKPFTYHAVGIGLVTVTVDCLLGTYKFDSVKVVHDFGKSMNKIIDLGQMEGGIVQGLGWMTIEELAYDEQGRLLSNSLSTYKIPDRSFAPEIETVFLENTSNPMGLFKSKAIGEPPLMYGIGGFFAIKHALQAYNPSIRVSYDAPLTPEKVLMSLFPKLSVEILAKKETS